MTYRSWLKKFRCPDGFTLIEAIVALAITGFLSAAIFTSLFQVRAVNNLDNAHLTAVTQVENAIHHINRDMQMAQKIEQDGTDEDAGNYWLKLTWTSWENNLQCKVIYQVEDNDLERQYFEKPGTVFSLIQSETVAQCITLTDATPPNPTPTPTTLPPEKFWTIRITASTLSGTKQAAETREIVILPRPGS
jgi:prepilin-type N-terminal cleavage/methylation domain-containing protein